jgi:PAS domain S-box-containing protein
MNQPYSYVLALLMVAVVAVIVATYVGRRHAAPGVWPLVALLLAAAVWSAAYALELVSEDLAAKLFWAKVQYLGIVTIAPAWYLFAIQYTARPSWFTRSLRNLSTLAIIPVMTLILVWTNEAHGLIWSETALDASAGFSTLKLEHGLWFWASSAYSYLLLLLGSIWIASMALQSIRLYRWQAGVVLLGLLVPWIANVLYVTDLAPTHLDLTPFAFLIAALAYAWSLFRFQLLDIVPVARRAVVDGLGDCVIVCDLQNRIVDVNLAVERLTGKGASELIGRPGEQILGYHTDLVMQCSAQQPVRAEIPMTVAGVPYYFDVRITPLLSPRDQIIGRLIVLYDITDRKRMEAELRQARDELELIVAERTATLVETNRQLRDELVRRRQAEDQFQGLFETAPDAMVVVGQEGHIIQANTQAEWIFGYTRHKLIGKHIQILLPKRFRDRHLNHLANYFAEPRLRPMGIGLDLWGQRRDGSEFPVEISLSPLETEDGLLVSAANRDVSDPVKAEEALRESEQTYRALFEEANDAIFLLSLDGVHLRVNQKAADMLGYQEDELAGMTYQDLVDPRDVQDAEGRLEALLAGQSLPVYERSFCTKAGDALPVELNVALVSDAEGNPKFIQSIVRDISERKQAEEALRESEAKFRNIIESSPLGMHMYQLELDGRLLLIEANPAADEILGIGHDRLIGKTIEEAFPEIAMTEVPQQFRRVAESGETWRTDQLLYEGDEVSGAFEIRAFQTSPGRMVAAFSNIAERILAQEEQARLLEEIGQQQEQLHALARQLSESQEAERKELARELHDQVGQNLTALDFHFNLVRSLLPEDLAASDRIRPQVDTSLDLLAQTADRIRDVMAELRPPMLDEFGLLAALEWYGWEFVAPRGIAFAVGGQEPEPRLAPTVEMALFRIAQEALTNVVKHARASQVDTRVDVDPQGDIVRLIVADDGTGFETPEQAGPRGRHHWGLMTMGERALGVGGRCRLDSRPGHGTRVIVEVPR